MIKKIRLENFLAHGSTEFELDRGMTVLTGPNNSGKSSIVEALRCISTNPAPKHFIRHGAKRAKVELELEDGVRVVWIREKGHARYEVHREGQEEAEVYAKFGRKPPDDVLSLIRLNLVPLENGSALDVHIGNQRNPIFLLDQSPGVAAQFFASSSEASHLLAMQTELKNKVRDAKRDRKAALQRMEDVRAELDALETLPDVELELEQARGAKAALDESGQAVPRLERMLEKLDLMAGNRNRLKRRESVLRKAAAPQELFPCAALSKVLVGLEGLYARNANARERAGRLEPLMAPSELFDSRKLSSAMDNRSRIEGRIRSLEQRSQRLESLSEPPDLFDAKDISATIRKISQARVFRDRVSRRVDRLDGIPQPPQLFELGPLKDALARVAEIRRQAKAEADKAQKLDSRKNELAELIRKRLEEEGNCPLCGADFDPDKFMEESS